MDTVMGTRLDQKVSLTNTSAPAGNVSHSSVDSCRLKRHPQPPDARVEDACVHMVQLSNWTDLMVGKRIAHSHMDCIQGPLSADSITDPVVGEKETPSPRLGPMNTAQIKSYHWPRWLPSRLAGAHPCDQMVQVSTWHGAPGDPAPLNGSTAKPPCSSRHPRTGGCLLHQTHHTPQAQRLQAAEKRPNHRFEVALTGAVHGLHLQRTPQREPRILPTGLASCPAQQELHAVYQCNSGMLLGAP